MQMDANEDSAIKETLEETRGIAAKMGITLSEALQLRQLVALRYLCQNKANEMKP